MKGESFLLTIAQVGLALAGFAGIISVFRHAGRNWIPQEIVGMKFIFEQTFGAVFFALLPFPIFYMWEVESRVWKIVSTVLACFLLFNIFLVIKRRRKMISQRTPPRRPKAIKYILMPGNTLLFIVQILNASIWSSLAGYAWGLLWLLIVTGFQFFYFVLFAFNPPSDVKDGKVGDA